MATFSLLQLDRLDGCARRGSSRLRVHVVGREALEVAHGHRLVEVLAVALALAGVLADAAAHRGQRAALADQLVGLLELAGRDQRDVALGVDARPDRRPCTGPCLRPWRCRRRWGWPAGRGGRWPCVCRALRSNSLGKRHRTGVGAIAAGVALAHVDVARALAQRHLEIAGLAADALDVGQGDDLDVLVARALDQLGREDAHGAVAGGEGLVELGHAAADGRRRLDQIDLEAGLGQVQRRLDAGDAGAGHHDRADGFRRLGGLPVGWLALFAHAARPRFQIGQQLAWG